MLQFAMCNISIFFIGHIVLYCSNKYCNISIYCNSVASLLLYVMYKGMVTKFNITDNMHKINIQYPMEMKVVMYTV